MDILIQKTCTDQHSAIGDIVDQNMLDQETQHAYSTRVLIKLGENTYMFSMTYRLRDGSIDPIMFISDSFAYCFEPEFRDNTATIHRTVAHESLDEKLPSVQNLIANLTLLAEVMQRSQLDITIGPDTAQHMSQHILS